jgi:hypothetical protein
MRFPKAGARLLLLSLACTAPTAAATLPTHGPLKLLVVSDEVNPHNLSDADLTQRGDISAALNAPDSGLNLDGPASEVYSQCVDAALSALGAAAPPDVVIYFAHQAARGCDMSEQQTALTSAFEQHLKRGGGVVVFHHGGYAMGGKDAMLSLLGVSASGNIPWDTTVGQRVFNVAPDHFVTTNHVTYTGKAALAGSGDVPSGMFQYFDNIPDERYPGTMLLKQSGETRTVLFASDSGGTRVLGYALERSGWQGRALFYQPAEYQPHALDDRAGPNFQILANAIVYSVHQEGGGEPGGGGSGGNGSGASGGTSAGAPSASGGASGPSGGRPDSGGAAASGGGASSAGMIGGGSNPAPTGSPGGGSATGSAGMSGGGSSATSATSAAPGASDTGCGCKLGAARPRAGAAWGSCLLLLALGRGRRSRCTSSRS